MPRRHGQAKPDVPRWRRGQHQPAHQPVVMPGKMSARQARKFAETFGAAVGHAAAGTGTPQQPGMPASGVLAKTGAYRFRKQLIPFAWLLSVAAAGLGTHAARAIPAGIILGLAAAGGIWLLTRHLPPFTRRAAEAIAALTALGLPALTLTGPKPALPLLLIAWASVQVPWAAHYRIRPEEAKAAAPALPMGDIDIWERLARKHKWSGHLEGFEKLPGGGRKWGITLDGAETHIGQVMAEPRRVAAAWGKPITGAYVEPSRDGIESRGSLTILRENTLASAAEWDGSGIDPETGCAAIARFPDALPALIRFYARRDGIRHGLIAGTTGSGKTYLLDLLIRIALTSGYIVPVVLDPQEGQSLPQWRKHVLYASGVEECMCMLRGLQAGMLDRSRYLSTLRWADDDGYEHEGMDFYDPFITGLPIVLIIGDEYPVLLTDQVHGPEAIRLTADIGKRGRKTGESLWPVAQVPSLTELGDQVVRSMLAGGNVICLRTGDRVSAGMLGLDADPSALPRYFPDGTPTWGLGYVVGPAQRQAPARVLAVSRAARRETPAIPRLDDRFAEAMDRAMKQGGAQLTIPASPLTAVVTDDGPAVPGRTASDAILAVLDEAGGELDRGQIIVRAGNLATKTWGRAKPFAVRTMSLALADLETAGRITKPRTGTYAPVRTTLHVVTGSAHAETQATGG